jgi:hypothetical protein
VLSKSTRSDLNKRLSFLEVRLIVCGGARGRGGGGGGGGVAGVGGVKAQLPRF